MTDDKQYVSKQKHEDLIQELEHLKNVKRKEIAEHLEFAKSLGDLSENAEYHEARQDQAEAEDRIAQIEKLLQTAEIIPASKGGAVDIGSTVTFKKKGDKTDRVYTIVGAEEANTAQGKISYKSPIGEALLGKQKGDTVTYTTPAGEVTVTISEVK